MNNKKAFYQLSYIPRPQPLFFEEDSYYVTLLALTSWQSPYTSLPSAEITGVLQHLACQHSFWALSLHLSIFPYQPTLQTAAGKIIAVLTSQLLQISAWSDLHFSPWAIRFFTLRASASRLWNMLESPDNWTDLHRSYRQHARCPCNFIFPVFLLALHTSCTEQECPCNGICMLTLRTLQGKIGFKL